MEVQPNICPCCKGQVTTTNLESLTRELPPVQGEVLRCLAKVPGRWITGEEIIPFVWSPVHEPKQPHRKVSQAVERLRRSLTGTGWGIESRRGWGGGYRLVIGS